MKLKTSKEQTLLISATILVLSIGIAMPQAFAAEGDTLATYTCGDTGVGVAYDGTNIFFIHGLSGTVMGVCDPTTNTPLPDIPITGLGTDVISTISFDNTRGLFWAATPDTGGSARNIYQIAPSGAATFMFTVTAAGFSLTDGLAYDGEDDSLWISGDVASTINHYKTDGTPIAQNIPIPLAPGNGCGNSGIAAGTGVLYLGFNGCNTVQKHKKSDLSLLTSFAVATGRTEDMECDPNTFAGVDAILTKDAFDSDIVAFEVPDGTCPLGGGTPVGGSILPIDTSALLIAGAFTNAIWMAPVLAGAAGTAAFYIKTRKN